MRRTRILICGAGPAGLTFANRLLDKGIQDFLLLEREKVPGGLCRSMEVDGAPYDIGGGHFLDTRNQGALDYLFRFMPEEEWNFFERNSQIALGSYMINSPIEANIWQLDVEEQIAYLKDIAAAGCNTGIEQPVSFVKWIEWKLGKKIAEEYMLPYNRKMFGNNLDQLGTYWLEKLPDVSFEDTLRSCLSKKAYGKQPGHASFYYPKETGYGEVWNRMAERVGKRLILDYPVHEMDVEKRSVNQEICGEVVINTVPWKDFTIYGLDQDTVRKIDELKYTSIVTEYVPSVLDTDAQWIYIPDEEKQYHRLLIRHNFSKKALGYWREINTDRFENENNADIIYYNNQYAYPLNTMNKPSVMENLLKELALYRIYGLGRWGEWQHYNSDIVVDKAIRMADEITNGGEI